MDVKRRLHEMIDEVNDIEAAVVHDYLIWFHSREQEPELTPEEEAAVEHDLEILRRHGAEEEIELTPEEQAAVDHDVALIRRWQEEERWDLDDADDDGIMFWDDSNGIIDIVDLPLDFRRGNGRRGPKWPEA